MGRFLAACSVLVLAVLGLGPHTGRYQTVTILSGSMGATAPAGAVAFSTPIPTSALQVGDVITYAIPVDDHRVVTHRVVEVVEGGDAPVIRTKGDANQTVDPWTARLDPGVAWKVRFSVPYAGYAVSFLRRPAVQLLLVRALPFLVALLWIRDIWGLSGWMPAAGRRLRSAARALGPGLARLSIVGVVLGAQLFAAQQAVSMWNDSPDTAPKPVMTSGALQPASGLNAVGKCDLLVLGSHVDLSWTPTPSTWAQGYKIERYKSGNYQTTFDVQGAATSSFRDTGTVGLSSYTYKLWAYRYGWTSATIEKSVNTGLCLL